MPDDAAPNVNDQHKQVEEHGLILVDLSPRRSVVVKRIGLGGFNRTARYVVGEVVFGPKSHGACLTFLMKDDLNDMFEQT